MIRKIKATAGIAIFVAAGHFATAAADQDITDYRREHEVQIISDFRAFLSLPNVATNITHMKVNANWITDYIGKRGFDSEVVEAGGAPYVIAQKMVPGADGTILIYAHFDGQPVAPENWASKPFEPTLRAGTVESGSEIIEWQGVTQFEPEWRIFARSAGDDKAPVIALMTALDALAANGKKPNVNIKLILDGEEEAGSPTLGRILEQHGKKLDADLMLFCDGPMHQSRQRQLVFGVRGSMTVDLTTYGPVRPLHSGHYGGWAPNPSEILIQLLASVKDEHGRITVPGYHDDVHRPTEAEQKAVDALPDMELQLKKELQLRTTDNPGKRIEETVMEPAIIVKGFQGGGVADKSRNIIMPSATASLNLRLAPGQTPAGVREKLTAFFQGQGFHVFTKPPTAKQRTQGKSLYADWRPGAYRAFRSSLNNASSQEIISILDSLDSGKTLLTPTMGGSLPIYLFEDTFPKMPIILLPIANHDNNQHGRNENLRIQNLWDAIDIYAAVLTKYGKGQ